MEGNDDNNLRDDINRRETSSIEGVNGWRCCWAIDSVKLTLSASQNFPTTLELWGENSLIALKVFFVSSNHDLNFSRDFRIIFAPRTVWLHNVKLHKYHSRAVTLRRTVEVLTSFHATLCAIQPRESFFPSLVSPSQFGLFRVFFFHPHSAFPSSLFSFPSFGFARRFFFV